MMLKPIKQRRITVHLTDGTDRSMVINRYLVEDGVVHFGRCDDASTENTSIFLSAPLTSIIYWD